MKVKNGAENMIQSISGAHHGRDKKLLAEAQQMLADSKAKIEFLKLRILKVRRNGQTSKVSIAWKVKERNKPLAINRFGGAQDFRLGCANVHECMSVCLIQTTTQCGPFGPM